MDDTTKITTLEQKLAKALWLLREWKDEFGGKAVIRIVNFGKTTAASPSDLLRDTQKFLEGK
jgi:hypothetical protein